MRDVYDRAEELGVHMATYSPGDGVTRYRFFTEDSHFFPNTDRIVLATVLGAGQARVWLSGYAAAKGVLSSV